MSGRASDTTVAPYPPGAAGLARALAAHADPGRAAHSQRFFRTGTGGYGAGDVFIGVRVPTTRAICKQYADLPPPELQRLLDSDVHEHRLAAVIIMAQRCRRKRTTKLDRDQLMHLYLHNVTAGRVNAWDIIDVSAEHVVGRQLVDRDRSLLLDLAGREEMWARRVAVLSTFAFIKTGDASTTLELAHRLLRDPHHLVHTAVGWMLREVGNRCSPALLTVFLDQHAADMPRTMLRYAIEKLSPQQRAAYRDRPSTSVPRRGDGVLRSQRE